VHQSDEEQAEQFSPQAVVQTPETAILVVKWYPEAQEMQFTVVDEQVLQLRSQVWHVPLLPETGKYPAAQVRQLDAEFTQVPHDAPHNSQELPFK
jgi:hypothetical protein